MTEPEPPATHEDILTEAKAAIVAFNLAAVRLQQAMAALQAFYDIQRVRQQ